MLLLQQVRLIDPVADSDQVMDVLMENGVIRAIAPHLTDLPSGTQIQPSQGLVLGPGLIDLYSHSGEPGFEERESLESLIQAAAAGGFTRLNILPDTNPAIDTPAAVTWLKTHSSLLPPPSSLLSCWAALTLDTQGQQMTELAELAACGVTGFSDGKPIANSALLRRLLEYLQPLNQPIALYACDRSLVGNGVVREGANSMRFGLPGSPTIAETAPLAALLECVADIGTPVHLMRISTARGVDLIRQAKSRGLPITASTSWMHLLFDTKSLGTYDPNLRLDPPLGNPADRVALIQAVRDGTLDAIAIDHSPFTYEEKTVAFSEAPTGAIGLEFALPLLWQAFVETHQWSALNLWHSLSDRPANCLGQKISPILPDQPAELILFDPQEEWIVDRQSLKSRSLNTPWLNQKIMGRVLQIWCP
ncbi:dihydroorotase [Phormidesmis sp. 146-35]